MARRSIGVWFVGMLCGSVVAQSQPVPVGYQQVASEYDLPAALLYALALTESGQSSLSYGQRVKAHWMRLTNTPAEMRLEYP